MEISMWSEHECRIYNIQKVKNVNQNQNGYTKRNRGNIPVCTESHAPVTERLLFFDRFRNAACSPNDWSLFTDPQIKTNRLMSRLHSETHKKKVWLAVCVFPIYRNSFSYVPLGETCECANHERYSGRSNKSDREDSCDWLELIAYSAQWDIEKHISAERNRKNKATTNYERSANSAP